MAGFVHTAYDTIEDLRRNLRDRYKDCHAVLKELLQNADDAGATELQISWVNGVEDARHPLLCGPLLLVTNNAAFTFRDSYAIHLAGAGTKGNDEGKIGKFGLGLKSVFHLCEAFFYLSDSLAAENAPEELKTFGRTGVLNPWSGARYAEWDAFVESDQGLLCNLILSSWETPPRRWFAICLPLRKQEHCREREDDDAGDWAIEPRYYGDASGAPPEDVFSQSRIASLRHMLPLMSTLERVTFVRLTGASASHPETVAAVYRDAVNHADWRKLSAGRAAESGTVSVKVSNTAVHVYAGVQEVLDNEKLARMPARLDWPRLDTQTEVGRKRAPAAVKQHAAVVIVEQPGCGALRVDRAVFLPLGDPPHAECQSRGARDFDLILHGYFFVDAGRRGVDFAPEHEQPTVRQAWNTTLYRIGTLPLIIPALQEFARAVAGTSDANTRLQLLTGLLNHPDCHLWRDHREEICRDWIWCFRISDGQGSWRAAQPKLPLILLPGDETTDPAIAFKVFPALGRLSGGAVVTFSGLPRLAGAPCTSWPQGFAEELISSVPVAKVVEDDSALAFLGNVVQEMRQQDDARHVPHFVRVSRQLFRQVPLSTLRDHEPQICGLVSQLPPETALVVPYKSELVRESERVYECVVRCDIAALPVPDLFVKQRAGARARLNSLDARSVLVALSSLRPAGAQEDAFYSLVGQAVSTVLASWSTNEPNLLAEFGDLPIFYVRNYATGRRGALSGRELKQAQDKRQLFAINASLCPKLQPALHGGEVLYLQTDRTLAAQLEATIGDIPGCDAATCAELLATHPPLTADAGRRVALLEELLRASRDDSPPVVCKALRYLLHGFAGDDGSKSLLMRCADAWSELAQCILTRAGEGWRLVPDSWLENTTAAQCRWLGIARCTADEVAAMLRDVDCGTVTCAPITASNTWLEVILREWPESGKEQLKRLPLFRRADGTYGPVTPHTFIRGGLPLPPEDVFPDLTLIEDQTGLVSERHLAATLAPEDLIATALDDPSCQRHWRFVLETMPNEPSDALRQKLRSTRWLPDVPGNGHSPASVIARDGLLGHVRALARAGRSLVHADDLSPELLRHPRYHAIAELYPRSEELYRVLGEALRGVTEFAVGEHAVEEASLPEFVAMFTRDGSECVMPAAWLFRTLQESGGGGTQWIARHLLPGVAAALDFERLEKALNYLAAQHDNAPGSDKRKILVLFNRYLIEAASASRLAGILPNIRLLNQRGQWTETSRLALRGENVAPECLLAREHIDAVQDRLGEGAGGERTAADPLIQREFDEGSLRVSAELLGEFLKTWRSDDVPDDAIAAVVAVLGDNDGYPALYEALRDARTLSAMRGLFTWHTSGPGWGERELMTKQHFCIVPADANTVLATNLLGDTFEAAVNTRIESLFDGFDGRSYFALPNEERCYVVRLRQINFAPLSTEDRLEILGRSVLSIRSLVHRQPEEDFQAIWNQITHVGQLDIVIAQEMILESSAMLLEAQLSVRASPPLKRLFNDWHQVRQRAKTAVSDSDQKAAEADRRQVLERLRQLLCTDEATQTLLIGEIRKRLAAASYAASSIPFELFQNADDAIVELETLCHDVDLLGKARPSELRHKFSVEVVALDDAQALRFFHWGRGINQFRIAAFDGRGDGFDRDMERMLVLQGSGKDDSGPGERRTGKFGLGFKSVFFVCDGPRVLSGMRSRFRVVAGVYPERLTEKDEARLQQALEREGDALRRGTVVELPLRCAADANTTIQRFRRLVGFLTVFARKIRRCSIGAPDSQPVQADWRPEPLIQGIDAGSVQIAPGKSLQVMVCRLGADGYCAVLFALSSNGFSAEALADIPELWVTTPTDEPTLGRVLVNGNFDVNPGRTQLRRTEHNAELAREMGAKLGDQLCRLFARGLEDWRAIATTLRCGDATSEAFWESLWSVCEPYAQERDGNGVVREILFGSEHCGVYRLIREHDALPTGLPNEHNGLTQIGAINWRIKGALEAPEVWAAATACRWVRERVRPGSVVSAPTLRTVDAFCPVAAEPLTLDRVVRGAFSDGYFAEIHTAHELGKLLPPVLLRRMRDDKRTASEEHELRVLLSEVKFRTADEDWCTASRLLIGHGDETDRREERRRAAFAPHDRVIASAYTGLALEFFLSCRGEMSASAREMASWILTAHDIETRKAALEYLEQGEQSFRVEQELKELKRTCARCWLDDEAALNAVMPADANRQAVVMGKLQKGAEFAQQQQQQFNSDRELPLTASRAPRQVFNDISEWWRRDGDEIVAHHDCTVYPGGHSPNLHWAASQQQLTNDPEVRRNWLVLLMLGSLYRIGRTTQHQHRGFLDLCVERRWLDTLADSSDDPSNWFNIMEDYLDSLQGEAAYYHWMAQFLAYYQLARWLPRYARAFEAVTRPGVNLNDLRSIRDIADLRTSHVFGGATGFDAPPCTKTLGIGAHFVLREAARLRARESRGAMPNPILSRFAFVPAQRTRRLVAQCLGLGDDQDRRAAVQLIDASTPRERAAGLLAQMCEKHLGEESTFGGSFDLPLLVLTWPRYASTRERIVGQTVSVAESESLDFLEESQGGDREME